MFSMINRVWGSGDDSPGKSTHVSDEDTGDETVDLFVVDGNDSTEIMSGAVVEYHEYDTQKNQNLNSPGGSKIMVSFSGTCSTTTKPIKKTFDCSGMCCFQRFDAEMFQWLCKKNSDEGEEYGMLAPNEKFASKFYSAITERIRASCSLGQQISAKLEKMDREKKKWNVLHDSVVVSIIKNESNLESFLIVQESGKNFRQSVLFQLLLSKNEYLYPSPNESAVVWVNDDFESGEGQQMYRVIFDCSDKTSIKRFIDTVELGPYECTKGTKATDDPIQQSVLAENNEYLDFWSEEGSGACAEADMTIQFKDKQSVQPQSVARDPSRNLWNKTPDTMLHKFMKVSKDRTFVVRGTANGHMKASNDIQVFGAGDNENEVVATIKSDKIKDGDRNLLLKNSMLCDGESKMLMLDENDRENVFLMDLQREKIVQKFQADNLQIQQILPSSKGNERTHDPTFVGLNSQSFFLMDTRQPGKPRQQTYTYKTKRQISCGATTRDGRVALGTKFGLLSLYDGEKNKDGEYKRAKNTLDGLGDAILHLSVTKDGLWLLGTCQHYLFLVPTLRKDGVSGFVSNFGSKSKPPPIVLRLQAQDIADYNLYNPTFTKAEFDEDETTILTSVNNFIVVWDFSLLKETGVQKYTMRPENDYIKDVAFAREGDAVVLTMPTTVWTERLCRD